MKWLSDGKPKLYRSETEGNMIVILSGVSFTPLDKTGRMVYTMSATVTEIAEYNMDNLLDYNLIPVNISSKIMNGFPRDLKKGDIISEEDYRTIIFYLPEYATDGTFVQHDSHEWQLICNNRRESEGDVLRKINTVIRNLTNESFIRGEIDPNINTDLMYVWNSSFDIPDKDYGDYVEIDTRGAIRNGSGKYTFSWNGNTASGAKLQGFTFRNGILSGTVSYNGSAEYAEKNTVQLKVIDDDRGQSATMDIMIGRFFKQLVFTPIDKKIPLGIAGVPVGPINIREHVSGGATFIATGKSQT